MDKDAYKIQLRYVEAILHRVYLLPAFKKQALGQGIFVNLKAR